ncbi:MAG: hypothetical protein Q9169_003206 [Polycauliona sp. 2 TL-2023]
MADQSRTRNDFIVQKVMGGKRQVRDPAGASLYPEFREILYDRIARTRLKQFEGGLWSDVSKSPDAVLLRNGKGNTPLHLAVIASTAASLQSLLETCHQSTAKTDAAGAEDKLETVLSELLPLAVRARKQDVVTLLLRYGVDANYKTSSGETALYIASRHGYDEIVSALLDAEDAKTTLEIYETSRKSTPLFIAFGWIDSAGRPKSMPLTEVTLGSPNTRNSGEAIVLNANAVPDLHQLPSYTSYAIEICAIAAAASVDAKGRVQLPVTEEIINNPWHFTTRTPEQVKIMFTISTLGAEKDSQVAFGLLLVTPPPLRKHVPKTAKDGFWKEGGPTQIVGHRESGANSATNTNLQLGENTIQSYQSAVQLGASAVEFDMQLTKDLVPVIFHDFLVMEAGGDTPLYSLRLDQFQHLSEAQIPKSDMPSMAEIRYAKRSGIRPNMRSKSVGAYDESRRLDLLDRMKYTESAMAGDHKGNLRGDSILGAFPTFVSMLTDLPTTTSFNVEMKYPMLWEAEDRHMEYFATEINAYVNVVLSTIDRLAGRRSITFSSFSPEVCILLTLRPTGLSGTFP